MHHDPFTLKIALSKSGNARGELYLDDGVTYDHMKGDFIWRGFTADKAGKKGLRIVSKDNGAAKPNEAVDGVALSSYKPANKFSESVSDVRVEKVIVLGLTSKPSSVKVERGNELAWEYIPGVSSSDKKEGAASVLVIKDPKVLIKNDWAIVIQ